jgi:putative ABC transport system permease protein
MPEWKPIIRELLAGLKLDGMREVEIVDELAQHLEDRYDALRSSGVPEAQAHLRALEELRDSQKLTEELLEIRLRPLPSQWECQNIMEDSCPDSFPI